MNSLNTIATSPLPWKRKLIFYAITCVISFLLLEFCLRVLFAFYVGPSMLLYGTPLDRQEIHTAATSTDSQREAKTYLHNMTQDEWNERRNVEIHSNTAFGYSKYFSNQKRVDFDVDTGERFTVTINSRGFRGTDFADQKESGVIRVLCLGASSTFGYFDRDEETYPVYLEQLLNERYLGKAKFEVINFGIPHLTSEQIYNLFVAEGLQLKPDIVTFYEGNNDSDPPQHWLNQSLINAAIKKLSRTLVTFKIVDSFFSKYLKQSLSEEAVTEISENFINQVSKIYSECSKRGILFIAANQQRNSQAFDRSLLKNMTYKQEVEKIKHKLENSGALIHPELAILIHSALMGKLNAWTDANQIPFVDVIGRLDHDRDVLVSWVHLSAKGNHMLAEALSDKILELQP